uniref:uncharacterized protein LOC122597407 n=1 Tax=Erigeron canadensis TaxID=72917 RepID=UPI001CB8C6AF|nr:uncharacterized protein LOC122597407 [Erigeron canadensis]
MESPNVLKETLRILRYNSITFMAIGALLICPVSTIHLSNILIDQSLVERVTSQLLLIAKSSGLPINPFVKQCCHEFSEMVISGIVCFPLYITLLLISKAAVAYLVECTYSRKKFDSYKFYVIMKTVWRRVFSTYLLICMVIIGCITLLIMLLICVSNLLFVFGLTSNLIAYIAIAIGLVFSLFLAHTLIVCDISMVISILEDVSGPQALLRSSVLIRGQTQVGLIIFLGSTIGMALVKGLFEYRMKSLGYEEKGSRIWERPVLVVIYSFLVLIDFMMSTVFYFSCKSYSLEASNVECKPVLENVCSPVGSLDED